MSNGDLPRAAVSPINCSERERAFLAEIVQSSEDSVVTIDFEGTITTWNRAAERLYGYPAAEALGRPLVMLTLPEDLALLQSRVEQVKRDQVVERFETIRVHKDGHEMWLSITLSPVKNGDGEVIGVSTFARDITVEKATGEALRVLAVEKERLLRTFTAAMASTQDFIYHFDLEGRFTFANQPLLDLWQLPLEAIVGKSFYELPYPREMAEMLQSQIQKVIATQRPVRGHTPYTSTAGTREYEYIFTPLLQADGGVEAVVGVTRDVTERASVEKELRVSEERLRLVVENAREYAIFSADLKGFVTVWNSGAEHILGYQEEEIVGRNAEIIFTPEDRAVGAPAEEMRTALAEGRATDERWHMRKDGSRFWGSGFLMAMHDTGGDAIGFVKILRDDTQAREAQQALEASREELWAALQETERARAEAEAAGEAKDHFLAVLSHELRTPLTPVLMAVSTLARRKDLSAQMGEALEMIERNVKIEAHFIDDLLDLTRISRGTLELVKEPMDLHRAVQHAVEISGADMEAKRQHLTVSLEATEHEITGDSTRLQQVFWNLLKNAAKFTPEGGEIHVRSRNEAGRWICEFHDTGIGFAPQDAAKLFDAFTQANSAVTREFGGLGLGLAISKATIDGHGGALSAQSAGLGKGATFAVELPLAGSSEASEGS